MDFFPSSPDPSSDEACYPCPESSSPVFHESVDSPVRIGSISTDCHDITEDYGVYTPSATQSLDEADSDPEDYIKFEPEPEPAPKRRKGLEEPYEIAPLQNAKRWSEWDDYVITLLKEGYNMGWRKIAQFIKGRHTWQGIQMHYLRTLKKRNCDLDPQESQKFLECLERDWANRFHRLAQDMGSEYTARRLARHAFKAVGLGHLLGPSQAEQQLRLLAENMVGGSKIPVSEKELKDVGRIEDPARLPYEALEYLREHDVTSAHDLVVLYLGPS